MKKRMKVACLISMACVMFFYKNVSAEITQAPNVSAQSENVTGVIKDDSGPVIGASVHVKGTTNGVVSDTNGAFTLMGVKKGDVILVAYLGHISQEIVYEGQKDISVHLKEDSKILKEVVVTALGMKREQKSLGYSMTELKGDDILTGDINPAASLKGRVAGLEIAGSDGGMFGSVKIQLRGASTLSSNNQPIYVVDGVVLDNAVSRSGDADWNTHASDWGNALKSLNPADFETVSILKGASATALYGSRGLNGAIVITTKNAKQGQGLGISVSQSIGVDYVYKQPDLQNVYGDGTISGYVNYGKSDKDKNWYAYDNQRQFKQNNKGKEMLNSEGMSYGPRFDGRNIEGYDLVTTRYSAVKNNYRNAFNAGFSTNTNVTIQGGDDKTTFYSTTAYLYRTGTLPNNSFERLNQLLKASRQITDRVSLAASVAFANSLPKNPQPNIGEYFVGGIFPREYDTQYYRHKYKGNHGGMASNNFGDSFGNVPGKSIWWLIYENQYTQKETNIRPSLELSIDLLDWLKFRAEGNYNYYYIRNETKELGSGFANEGGFYRLLQNTKEQTNLNLNFLVNKDLGAWHFGGFLRGEYYNNFGQEMIMKTEGGLVVPGQYFIANSKDQPSFSGKIIDAKRTLSVAFQASASWKNQLYIDVTGRNDWSSALVYSNKTGNYSYFYPSVNGAWLVNESFQLPHWVSLAKIRASWAQVGNDTDPYKINSAYGLKSTQQSDYFLNSLTIPETMYSTNLKPERKNAWELGIDWRFINNRINLDVAYYKENTYNQIMEITVPSESGIRNRLINAGNIQNQGVEVALNTIPFQNKDWEWSLNFTYTKNASKIVELDKNVSEYIPLEGSSSYGNYRIASVAKIGAAYGLLMTDSKPKIDQATGLEILRWIDSKRSAFAERSGKVEEIGKLTPDFLGSLTTGLKWKNLSVHVALDTRIGGYVASYGSRYGTTYGYTEASLKYSSPERGGVRWKSKFDGITYSDGVVPNGLIPAGIAITQPDGSQYIVKEGGESFRSLYEKGIVEPIHASAWNYRRNSWGQGVVNDDWFKKLNYIALREISIGYRFSAQAASKIGAKNLSMILSARNLGYLYNTAPSRENPESVRGTRTNEFRLRSFEAHTANYLFTVNVGF